ncbi:MAG: type I DNA topoisomerase [Sediminibacterium sp.]|nr:type I DNA topoisomerase [Sediminibacterium sp.]
MAKNLLIVESPAKAKTIEKILGTDFEVKSCFGHIRDLDKENMGIDLENGYEPTYIIPEDKEKVVKELRAAAKKSSEIWLASDEDREGESISWHLSQVLGLDPLNTKRIVFHEITPKAIKKAVANPRTIDLNLVKAQQARRVLDRLVGFELSPVLWRKISKNQGLSAGRVQSVAVRLIADREREINQFNSKNSFKIEGLFNATNQNNKNQLFKAEGDKNIENMEDALAFINSCKGANYIIENIQVKPSKRTPTAPFTTSTLQQEASRKLGYGVSRTMQLAQKLYESGKITYMRTDSVYLSDSALDDIQHTIEQNYGKKYVQLRKYKNKNESAQEAHEAIRPTYMENKSVDDSDTKKLYELIWKRTIASQMADAELEKTIVTIDISTNHKKLTANGEVVLFDGFLTIYFESDDDLEDNEEDNNKLLPPLKVNQQVDLEELLSIEKFSKATARFTEASLVKKLEELGIGRPSTYAPTISTIVKRNYVEKKSKDGVQRTARIIKLFPDDKIQHIEKIENTGAEKNKLFPTDLGLVVTDFLIQHFTQVMDFKFTAKIEAEFDEIAEGKIKWNKMIDIFYKPFHNLIDSTLLNAERASGEREIGIDPKSGKKIIARMARFGPIVQLGENNDTEKAKFAGLKNNQSIETISLEEALSLFELPRNIGIFEDKPIVINIGRFGPYAQHNAKFYSLGKEKDPYTIDLPDAIELIEAKRIQEQNKIIKSFEKEDIVVLNGQWGPYIKQGKENYKIDKKTYPDATTLDLETLIEIIQIQKNNPAPKKKSFRKKG